MIRDLDSMVYQSRVFRTKQLRESSAKQVEIMVRSFLSKDGFIEFQDIDSPKPGFPYAKNDKVSATFRSDRSPDYAHIFVTAENRDACFAKILAVILEGHGWFPMT